jgi:hypothetical protein
MFAGDEDWEDMTCSMCDEVLDNSSTFFWCKKDCV